MRVIIKIKKEQAHHILALLKFRGFKPNPDRPVTIDFRNPYVVLMGELADNEIALVRKVPEVQSVSADPGIPSSNMS